MKVEIKIVKNLETPYIVIYANEITPYISDIVRKLSEESSFLVGYMDDEILLMNPQDIFSIETKRNIVVAHYDSKVVKLKYRLYELEEKLQSGGFLRISNSEIVNFKKVESLDMSISGTISLRLNNGSKSFVSRRYIDKIKKYLGI